MPDSSLLPKESAVKSTVDKAPQSAEAEATAIPEPVRPQLADKARDFQIAAEYYADEHQPATEPLPLTAEGQGRELTGFWQFWRRSWARLKAGHLNTRWPWTRER
ncbi:hypothetical protein HCH52_07735 [Oscillospiraceae bacterium HV4-5-C5C]|nr:hypothetical protein [Oscillospiraceae bacterium HV4-5-C5C]